MKKITSVLVVATCLLGGLTVQATPFASCISNIANNVYFNLNEPGGNVTVTYEDGSTNTSFNGSTTGTNLPVGYQHFDLTGHTSYKISVFKIGSGSPSIITNIARNNGRGIAANVRGTSPYFGYVYSLIGGAGTVMMRSDGTGPVPGSSLKPTANGFTWGTSTSAEYFISVAPDDSVLVSDFTSASEGGVIRVNPAFTSSDLLLANLTGLLPDDTVDYNHGDAESRAILTAGIGTNPTLYVIDGTYQDPYNQIMTYHLGSANYGNGTLPWPTAPDVIGAVVNPAGIQGAGSTGFFRDGLSIGTNGYFYVSVDRANLSNPNLQVYGPDSVSLLWSSYYTNGTTRQDYTVTGTTQLPETGSGPCELCLSPDNRFLALIHDDTHLTIFSLTNGIPDISTEYLINAHSELRPLGTGLAGRGVCWDAANNLWISCTAPTPQGVLQISTGRTATAITSGNSSGPTGFQLLSPTEIDITSVQALAPQANSYAGYPVASTNTITRSGDVSSPLSVPFVLSGTAAAGTYIVNVTNTINFAPGQSSTNVIVTAVTDGIPRPTTTVIMTLQENGSGQYTVGFQNQATTFIINTATPQLSAAVAAGSMYKAYSNDYSSITLTRVGDTNVAVTTAAFTYGGAAVRNTDYATISTTTTFNKGDLTKTVKIAKPLVNGLPPVHTSNPTYTGDKTFTVTVPAGTGYTVTNNSATLKIVDNAYPAATVLYSNPLTDVNDAANWNLTALCGDDSLLPDYTVEFGYDLTPSNGESSNNGLIPMPPNGATTALRITTGKQFGNEANAVNLYLTNQPLSGNYAVRFSMYIVQGQNIAASDEGPLFGVNHDGFETNWWYGSGTLTGGPWSADGVWYWIDAWAGGLGADYREFTGISNNIPNSGWRNPATSTAASWTTVFKNPEDFTTLNSTTNAVAGLPANASPILKPNLIGNWADVEIMNSNNVVKLSINKQQIFSFNNTNSLFQQGDIMLGYENPAASQTGAGPDAAVYFSGLQVVSVSSGTVQPPTITSTSVVGGNVIINFTSPNSTDTTSSFTVRTVPVVTGTFADTPATITGGSGTFQATLPASGATEFYRIHHN